MSEKSPERTHGADVCCELSGESTESTIVLLYFVQPKCCCLQATMLAHQEKESSPTSSRLLLFNQPKATRMIVDDS